MGYIHSSKMRAFLNLILKFQELTTTVNMLDADGKPKPHQIYYRMRQSEDGKVELNGYPIMGLGVEDAITQESGLSVVVAEEAFYRGDYWVGSPKDVYKDIAVGNRQAAKAVWAAAFENEKFYAFAIDEANPLVTLIFTKKQLERLAAPSAAPAVMVGSVDDTTGAVSITKGTGVSTGVKPALVDDLAEAQARSVKDHEAEQGARRINDALDKIESTASKPGGALLGGLKRMISGTSGDHPLTSTTPNPGHA